MTAREFLESKNIWVGTFVANQDSPENYSNLEKMLDEYLKANLPTDKVNRVEVIDEDGRSYVNWKENNKVTTSIQDDGRTLKVIIRN